MRAILELNEKRCYLMQAKARASESKFFANDALNKEHLAKVNKELKAVIRQMQKLIGGEK